MSLISVPGQTLLQDSDLCGCLSPDSSSIQGPSPVFGVRAHSHFQGVLIRTRSQPALQSAPQSGEIPRTEEELPTDRLDGYLLILQSPGELGVQLTTDSVALSCTKSKAAFRTACAKDKKGRSFKTGCSFLFHMLYVTQSFHFLPPCVLVSLSGCYSCSRASISCFHSPANSLQTLTWKHQQTVKTRPVAFTNCCNTQAAGKLVVAGLWGGRHVLGPQRH